MSVQCRQAHHPARARRAFAPRTEPLRTEPLRTEPLRTETAVFCSRNTTRGRGTVFMQAINQHAFIFSSNFWEIIIKYLNFLEFKFLEFSAK